jgi:uroporphyrinogen decarboxylase
MNIDYEVDPKWAKANLKNVVIQGGLDPKILLNSEEDIMGVAKKYLDTFQDLPYVFNLGHGLLPSTDPDKVERLIKFYRNY